MHLFLSGAFNSTVEDNVAQFCQEEEELVCRIKETELFFKVRVGNLYRMFRCSGMQFCCRAHTITR